MRYDATSGPSTKFAPAQREAVYAASDTTTALWILSPQQMLGREEEVSPTRELGVTMTGEESFQSGERARTLVEREGAIVLTRGSEWTRLRPSPCAHRVHRVEHGARRVEARSCPCQELGCCRKRIP